MEEVMGDLLDGCPLHGAPNDNINCKIANKM